MGHVEDAHDAVDQGETEGDEGINCPHGDTVEQLLKEKLHGR